MAYRDLLVHVDNSKACEVRMRLALAIAEAHGAHLTALFARKQGPDYDAALANSKQRFDAAAGQNDGNLEWRVAEPEKGEVRVLNSIVMHSHYADMVIVGQYDAHETAWGSRNDLPEQVVLQSGRPVLTVPYAGKFQQVGKRALVAWNGSREAVRAVNDAIPMLQLADAVTVLALNPDRGESTGHGEIPCADICLHLARHGIKAEAQHLVAKDIDAGNMLLSMAADEGADMIVMGGYGQPRLRELVLGGATHAILKHMTVPVLMSH